MGRDGASTISSESSEFTSSGGVGAVGCSPETGGSAETETGASWPCSGPRADDQAALRHTASPQDRGSAETNTGGVNCHTRGPGQTTG